MRNTLFVLFLMAVMGAIGAQTPDHVRPKTCPLKQTAEPSPYAGYEKREIKALSDADREQLLAGHGMGLALAAELNRFPGPKHVLELTTGLDLSDEQIRRTEQIFDEMQERAQHLGLEVIAREAELDAKFASRQIDEDQLTRSVSEIGRVRAELRLAHLRAHLQMRAIMSDEQVAAYDRLRGYDAR